MVEGLVGFAARLLPAAGFLPATTGTLDMPANGPGLRQSPASGAMRWHGLRQVQSDSGIRGRQGSSYSTISLAQIPPADAGGTDKIPPADEGGTDIIAG